MNRLANFHCHTTFGDGADCVEAMVQAAIEKGFGALGVSEHGWASYDTDCCIKKDRVPAYFAELDRLKKKYSDVIEIYTGMEIDYYQPMDKDGLDYTIGSVHYLLDEKTGTYYSIDYLPDTFEQARDRIFQGNIRRMVEAYYDNVCDMAEQYKPDIVGHLDLIKKLNKDQGYFDESAPWYTDAVVSAANRISKTDCIVEVNTGGVYRGYCTEVYPSEAILKLLFERGVPVMLSSDAHNTQSLDYMFRETEALLTKIGYRSVKQLADGEFVDVEL